MAKDAGSAARPTVYISARGAARLEAGHPWVFKSDIKDSGAANNGEVVRVAIRRRSGGEKLLGQAFFSSHSIITLRLISGDERPCDREFWRERLQAALDGRRLIGGEDEAGRLVFAEADGLPGLIVDRYGAALSIQTLCAGAERLKELWLELLEELLRPRAVVERNDTASRRLEGLEERAGLLRGVLGGPVTVRLGGLMRQVDLLEGQKTGAYLDQRENYLRAARLAHGRCLDVFSYQGGFGLSLARAGAAEVILVDQSEKSLQLAARDAELNRLEVRTQGGNAFDLLHRWQKEGERFDLIVLDPPAFAKNRAAVEAAQRGYKEINLRALKLLHPGGVLVSCSCSHHLQEPLFEKMLLDAARDAGRTLQILERRGAAADHPERLGFPESKYLKCFIMRVLD
jgi:23S rRNA (cytosine1962-C5)-methyltransferase